mgnify:CR=1 FL=1
MARPKKAVVEESVLDELAAEALETIEAVEVVEEKEGFAKVYLSSFGVEHNKVGDQKFIKLNCNGEDYNMPLDVQTEIPERFFGCVSGLLEKQNG